MITEWKQTLATLIVDPLRKSLHNLDAAEYWPKQLKRTDLQLSLDFRKLVQRILLTSFTSADAERAFSMVYKIKTPDRINLTPKSLENLVRVKYNGPSELSDESLYTYTKDFVKKTSRVDDNSVIGGIQPRPDAFKHLTKSNIF